MAANPNWTRWIVASVVKYLKDVADANNIPSLIEGVEERTTDVSQDNKAEIRVNGPFLTEVSKDYFKGTVGVNVHITYRIDEDVYGIHKWCGVFLEAMTGNIPILKLGEAGEDQSRIACLSTDDSKDPIRVLYFGQVDKTDRVLQVVVDARYVVELGAA